MRVGGSRLELHKISFSSIWGQDKHASVYITNGKSITGLTVEKARE